MTQSILIGNPLQLTRQGILELHKLKHKETYCYLVTEENTPFDPFSEVKMVSDEKFLQVNNEEEVNLNLFIFRFILPFAVDEHSWGKESLQEFLNEVKDIAKTNQTCLEPHQILYFMSEWKYPKDHQRTDKDLLRLYKTNKKAFFKEDSNPREFVIPKDVIWYIDESYLGREYIREKGRVWG